MIEISNEVYCALAAFLKEAIGPADYFNGKVEYETEEFLATLTVTAIVYRRTEIFPDGERRPVTDVVPMWWALTTVQECGEVFNDFSFSELRPYLVDHQ